MSKSNNKTKNQVTVTLKDGSSITLRDNDRFTVRGQICYSHFLSPLSPKQIESKNDRRDKWAKSEDRVGPYYHDDPNVPYGELTIKNVDIISRCPGRTTDSERFALDHFFESVNFDHGIKKMSLKHYAAQLSTGAMNNEGQFMNCPFDDELNLGSEVICEGIIYFTKTGKPAIELTGVYTVGAPVYLDRSKYRNKRAAAA